MIAFVIRLVLAIAVASIAVVIMAGSVNLAAAALQ